MSEQPKNPNTPSIHSDMCMDPVCMADTMDLIREIKKRYTTGAFVLYEPVPQNQDQYEEWVKINQETGFVARPERYHRRINHWGHETLLLGSLSRLMHMLNDDLNNSETDIPKEELF